MHLGLDEKALREVLSCLARQGYVLIDSLPRAGRSLVPLLLEQRVAYILARSSQHVGSYSLLDMEAASASSVNVDRQIRVSDDTVLLPYKQATRLVILHALEQMEIESKNKEPDAEKC